MEDPVRLFLLVLLAAVTSIAVAYDIPPGMLVP